MNVKYKIVFGFCVYLFVAAPTWSAIATSMDSELETAIKLEKQTNKDIAKFVENVLTAHPEVQSAMAEIESAKYLVSGNAKPLYNPELEVEAEHGDVSKFTMGMNQTVDWHNKKSAQLSEAELQLHAAEKKLTLIRERLAANLLFSIVRFLSTKDVSTLEKQSVKMMQRFVELAENRRKAGDIPQIELDTARLALTEAIVHYSQSNAALISAQGEILSVTGASIGSSIPFPTELPSGIKKDIDISALAINHPEMELEKLNVQIAKSQVNVSDVVRKADPNFGFSAGVEDSEALVTLNFTMPLQIRNNFSSDVSSARQLVIQAEQQSQARYRKIHANISASSKKYSVMSSAWKYWKTKGQIVVKQHLATMEKLWETGEINTTQYLVQLQQVISTQVSGATLQGDIWQSWIEWLESVGGVNEWLNTYKTGENNDA